MTEQINTYLNTKPDLTAVVVGYLVRNDRVLLGLRKKVSFGLGENLISGIGGKLEIGESNNEALIREFTEEIKVKPTLFTDQGVVTFLFPHKPKWNQVCTVFLIKEWLGVPLETDVIKPAWYNTTELPKTQMWPDNLIWVPKILEGEIINATFLYDENGQILEYVL